MQYISYVALDTYNSFVLDTEAPTPPDGLQFFVRSMSYHRYELNDAVSRTNVFGCCTDYLNSI